MQFKCKVSPAGKITAHITCKSKVQVSLITHHCCCVLWRCSASFLFCYCWATCTVVYRNAVYRFLYCIDQSWFSVVGLLYRPNTGCWHGHCMFLFSVVDLHPWGCNVDPGKNSPGTGTGLEGCPGRERRRRGGKTPRGKREGNGVREMGVNLNEKGRQGEVNVSMIPKLQDSDCAFMH